MVLEISAFSHYSIPNKVWPEKGGDEARSEEQGEARTAGGTTVFDEGLRACDSALLAAATPRRALGGVAAETHQTPTVACGRMCRR